MYSTLTKIACANWEYMQMRKGRLKISGVEPRWEWVARSALQARAAGQR